MRRKIIASTTSSITRMMLSKTVFEKAWVYDGQDYDENPVQIIIKNESSPIDGRKVFYVEVYNKKTGNIKSKNFGTKAIAEAEAMRVHDFLVTKKNDDLNLAGWEELEVQPESSDEVQNNMVQKQPGTKEAPSVDESEEPPEKQIKDEDEDEDSDSEEDEDSEETDGDGDEEVEDTEDTEDDEEVEDTEDTEDDEEVEDTDSDNVEDTEEETDTEDSEDTEDDEEVEDTEDTNDEEVEDTEDSEKKDLSDLSNNDFNNILDDALGDDNDSENEETEETDSEEDSEKDTEDSGENTDEEVVASREELNNIHRENRENYLKSKNEEKR